MSTINKTGLLALTALPLVALCALAAAPRVVWQQPAPYALRPTLVARRDKQGWDVVLAGTSGTVVALSGKDGHPLWQFAAGGSIAGCPAVADVDGDGSPEIILGASNRQVYALSARDGRPEWTMKTVGGVVASPLIVDVNGNGKLDVVIPCQHGNVYALEGATGRILWTRELRRPVETPVLAGDFEGDRSLDLLAVTNTGDATVLDARYGSVKTQRALIEAPTDAPVAVDTNRDGSDEVFLPGATVRALSVRRGVMEDLWFFGAKVSTGLALADLDADGVPEVLVGDSDGRVHAVNVFTGKAMWSAQVGDGSAPVRGTPLVGDVNGDHQPEVLALSSKGRLVTFDARGKPLWEIAHVNSDDRTDSAPLLADINGDGLLDLGLMPNAQQFALVALGGSGQIQWGKPSGDAANTGTFNGAVAFGRRLRSG
ncbi:MAG: PQQ-binding-like beta-propeller repeat protein [Abditibacteriales bacterium]|nr:PQQ-binding-like beta-propeller repeat protein [Abditibacteriales bacterium]MDW8365924.1 PQQ-binding-like beta-propeller repeat protein [Abditibacteriales bacterium]